MRAMLVAMVMLLVAACTTTTGEPSPAPTVTGWVATTQLIEQSENGTKFIVVKGDLVNKSDSKGVAPTLRVYLRDGEGRELRHWTVQPDQAHVPVGGRTTFTTRFEPLPGLADFQLKLFPPN